MFFKKMTGLKNRVVLTLGGWTIHGVPMGANSNPGWTLRVGSQLCLHLSGILHISTWLWILIQPATTSGAHVEWSWAWPPNPHIPSKKM